MSISYQVIIRAQFGGWWTKSLETIHPITINSKAHSKESKVQIYEELSSYGEDIINLSTNAT